MRIFRQQRGGGGDRFGNWHGRMAEALIKPLTDAYLHWVGKLLPARSAIESFASGEDQMSWALETAKAQAAELAVQLNDATTNMLENGRTYKEVFSSDRAAIIGVDQAARAEMACQVRAAQVKKVKLKWVTMGPKPCGACKKLNGKIRNPGKAFAIVNGEPVFHPRLHPHCFCELEEVSA